MTQRRGSVRRATRWIDTSIDTPVTAGTPQNLTLLGALGADDIPGLTLTRLLVHLTMFANASPTAFGAVEMGVGIGLATGDAFAAAALPDVETDTDFPIRGWVLRDSLVLPYEVDSTEYREMRLDLRAQRKLDEQTELFIQFRNETMVGTALVCRMTGLVRALMKMP